MTFFQCPYLDGLVELNAERERHIRENHSELLLDFYQYIATTLAEPEHIQRSQTHENTRLFTRWDEPRAKYVQVRHCGGGQRCRPARLDCHRIHR